MIDNEIIAEGIERMLERTLAEMMRLEQFTGIDLADHECRVTLTGDTEQWEIVVTKRYN